MSAYPIGDLASSLQGKSIPDTAAAYGQVLQDTGVMSSDGSISPLAKYSNDMDGFSNHALVAYQEAMKDNPDLQDAYLQLIAERENTLQAQDWYERMSGSQYSRAMEDIKKAGYNPYLVLQGLSGAGSGSVSPAGTSSISGSQIRATREGNVSNMIKAVASVAGIAVAIAALL